MIKSRKFDGGIERDWRLGKMRIECVNIRTYGILLNSLTDTKRLEKSPYLCSIEISYGIVNVASLCIPTQATATVAKFFCRLPSFPQTSSSYTSFLLYCAYS